MIPFLDLKAQHAGLRTELLEAVARVVDSCEFTLGSEVEAFEREFAAFVGTRHAIGVNSGTSALHLALLAAGVGAGDEVLTVPFTFVATAAAIGYTGARPVFVDIDPRTLAMDPARLAAAITERTRAIVPVHLHGRPAEMDPIMEVARRHRLAVIEDAAQAHGAEYRGRRAGGIGDLGCFSFYPGKNLGACGEAGMVTTDSDAHARTLRMLRDWGAERRYHHVLKGFNYRLEGVQAAVLRVKLRRLDAWNEARRARAARYDAMLRGSGIGTPAPIEDGRAVHHVYAVRVPRRDAVKAALDAQGIACGIHYPTPVHLQPAWADLGHRAGAFPCAERAAAETLSLPMYPELEPRQAEQVVAALRRAVERS